METIFTKIIKGEIPSYKVHEDDNCLAFLDINPNAYGHTLCVLKKQIDYIFDLSSDEYDLLMKFSRKVALGIEKTVDCERIGMAVVGLEVPHAHIHLIPINNVQDMNFSNKINTSSVDLAKLSKRISDNIY